MYLGHNNRGLASLNNPGFLGQSGYTLSGTIGWDQNVTLSNNASPFTVNGSAAPTLVMFDDFRNGTAGNVVANNTPGVAGSSNWLNTIVSGGTNASYQSTNRSGSGQCLRIRQNGDADTVYEALNLQFANTTGLYIFFGENSHGADYGTLTGAGTGNNWNYKLNWFMYNNFTKQAFNMVMMDVVNGLGQQFGSNDNPPFAPWDSGGGASYDPNNWNSIEYGYIGDPVNPTTADGRMFHGEWNVRNGGRHGATNTSQVLFNSGSGSSGTYSVGNSLAFPGLIEGAPSTLVIDRADAYIAIGSTAACRVMIGNASTIAACTSMMPCDITSWSAGAISFNLRQGAAASPSGNYVFWFDALNNGTPAGQFL